MYYSVIQYNLLYGVISWGGAHTYCNDHLLIIQIAIIKFGLNYMLGVSEIFLLSNQQLFIKTWITYA